MAKMIQAGPQSYYIQSPAKIGIYKINENEVYLIDSGGDKDAAKKTKKLLDTQGWKLKGILNTHSHADHIGGNRYLQQQFKCPVFSGGIEGAFTQYPILEPSFLYGGFPLSDLKHKLLFADGSIPFGFDHPEFPKEVKIIPLPGHTFDMVGFGLPDGTVFLADCLSSESTLEKYKITFLYDVASYLKTLDSICQIEGKLFIPAHTDVTTDIKPLAQLNRTKVLEIIDHIKVICENPINFDRILQQVFIDYNLTMTAEQHALVGSTLKSYLSYLKDTKQITLTFQDNMQLWQTVQ